MYKNNARIQAAETVYRVINLVLYSKTYGTNTYGKFVHYLNNLIVYYV